MKEIRTENFLLAKLATAYFYDGDSEPSTINLHDCNVLNNPSDFLSGYSGTFSQTKGFVPIKREADRRGQSYTIIDYTVELSASSSAQVINLKDLSAEGQNRLVKNLDICNQTISKIIASDGLHRAVIKDPNILTALKPYFLQINVDLIFYSVMPEKSPALLVGSLLGPFDGRIVSAKCRFAPESRIIY
jgi:hypothetical protein